MSKVQLTAVIGREGDGYVASIRHGVCSANPSQIGVLVRNPRGERAAGGRLGRFCRPRGDGKVHPLNGYVALCPELDIASQGDSVEEARQNLIEAVELFFESADAAEVRSRLQAEVFVTQMEIAIG